MNFVRNLVKQKEAIGDRENGLSRSHLDIFPDQKSRGLPIVSSRANR